MFTKVFIFASFIALIYAKNSIGPEVCLGHNEKLTSNNGCFEMIMQHDGNAVIYRKSSGEPMWSTGTARSCSNRICMQGDGNFVLYDCHNKSTWSSGSVNNEGSSITMQDDGNLVINKPFSNRPVWASGTVRSC